MDRTWLGLGHDRYEKALPVGGNVVELVRGGGARLEQQDRRAEIQAALLLLDVDAVELELGRPCGQGILSPLRLPVPPLRHGVDSTWFR